MDEVKENLFNWRNAAIKEMKKSLINRQTIRLQQSFKEEEMNAESAFSEKLENT